MAHVTGRVHRIPQHFHSCPIIAAFAVSVARSLRNRNFSFQCEIKNSLNHRRKSPQPKERPAPEIMDGKQWHSGDLISAAASGSWRTFCGCWAKRKNFGNFRQTRKFFLFIKSWLNRFANEARRPARKFKCHRSSKCRRSASQKPPTNKWKKNFAFSRCLVKRFSLTSDLISVTDEWRIRSRIDFYF